MQYDLESRTYDFAVNVRNFVISLKRDLVNFEYNKQLIRSSSSIGANYIEANESFSEKDYFMRVKICRKEAKETIYWLRLLVLSQADLARSHELIDEATQLMKIFGKILNNTKQT